MDKNYKEFCENIDSYFLKSQYVIVENRNIIKIVDFKDQNYVVKSFKVPHLFNRFIYTFFRSSKAKKSYNNAKKIDKFTPKAICFVVRKKFGLISNSYFISQEFRYDFTIREVLLDPKFQDRDIIFSNFSDFTYELHQNGILHLDYSPGNILIKKLEDGYEFKVVDINRMIFKKLNSVERVENFSKLWATDEDLIKIIKRYAKVLKEDELSLLKYGLLASNKHKSRKNFKKRLKGISVVD